jgi:selenide,water dikinase
LCGINGSEDAGVYKLNDSTALIFTLDFFTPIVDSPYHFGKIAAANSLSDIYAMGGKPLIALNILCIPSNISPVAVEEILKGGLEKVKEAGAFLLGGHSIQDKEPKYGLAVVGASKPEDIKRNNSAKEGDLLYLTKPLGVGILTTALKRKKLKEDDLKEVIEGMEKLNNISAELALKFNADALTDVTGFGLIGHLSEMLREDLGVSIFFSKIPFYENSLKFAKEYVFPGGAYSNQKYYENILKAEGNFEDEKVLALFSPETSGGLLVAISEEKKDIFEEEAKKKNQDVFLIGKFFKGKGIVLKD